MTACSGKTEEKQIFLRSNFKNRNVQLKNIGKPKCPYKRKKILGSAVSPKATFCTGTRPAIWLHNVHLTPCELQQRPECRVESLKKYYDAWLGRSVRLHQVVQSVGHQTLELEVWVRNPCCVPADEVRSHSTSSIRNSLHCGDYNTAPEAVATNHPEKLYR